MLLHVTTYMNLNMRERSQAGRRHVCATFLLVCNQWPRTQWLDTHSSITSRSWGRSLGTAQLGFLLRNQDVG